MTPYVFLDLDGTLMRSDPGIMSSVRHVLDALGVPQPEADPTWLIGPTLDYSFPKLGVPKDQVGRALELYHAVYDIEGFKEAEVYDGVMQSLEALRAMGCQMALATSKPRVIATEVVKHFGIAPYLSHIFGAEAEGHDTSKKANLLSLGMATTGATPQASVMVGDRVYDVTGAKSHGMAVIGAAYGYGGADELSAAGADRVIPSARDLPQVVAEILDI